MATQPVRNQDPIRFGNDVELDAQCWVALKFRSPDYASWDNAEWPGRWLGTLVFYPAWKQRVQEKIVALVSIQDIS